MVNLVTFRGLRFPLLLIVVAALLLGSAASGPFTQISDALALNCPAQQPMLAVFTGEVEGGAPVYRLPTISVAANRGAVVAERTQKRDPREVRGRARAAS